MPNTPVYYSTQSAALIATEESVRKSGYDINYSDNLWTEHVGYGETVKYNFPLTVVKTGGLAKKWVHIQLYRMGNGGYELNFYIS